MADFKKTNCFQRPEKGYLLTGILESGKIEIGDFIMIDSEKKINILEIELTGIEQHYALTIPFETENILGDIKIYELYGRTVTIKKYSA